jgi:hypothetical protein
MPNNREIGNINSGGDERSNSRSNWLKKNYFKIGTKPETKEPDTPLAEISEIKKTWEEMCKRLNKTKNEEILIAVQISRELARKSNLTGENWKNLKETFISSLMKLGIDYDSANKDLEDWKRLGNLQRTTPKFLQDTEKKAITMHLIKQEGLEKGLGIHGLNNMI